jgi:hypothetical protein
LTHSSTQNYEEESETSNFIKAKRKNTFNFENDFAKITTREDILNPLKKELGSTLLNLLSPKEETRRNKWDVSLTIVENQNNPSNILLFLNKTDFNFDINYVKISVYDGEGKFNESFKVIEGFWGTTPA